MSVTVRPYTKRGKSGWEVDLVVRLPDGRVVRERTKSPLPSKSATRLWAEQRAAHLLSEGLAGSRPKAPSFGDFFERFIGGYAVANREKPSSVLGKRSIWRLYLEPRYAKTPLDELGPEAVQQLKGQLAHLSPKTVNNVLSLLNTMLRTAHEWGVLSAAPVRIRMLEARSEDVRFYEPAEYERLVAAAAALDPQILAMVLLGGDAGLRSGEMLGLRWSDVDVRTNVLTVRRAIWRGHVTLPKSGKGRALPMTVRLARTLGAFRHLVRDEVLYRPDGGQATRSTLHKWLLRAERRAGLPADGALHRLRHTFCSRLAREGAPAAAIQALAGHSSFATTARYIHLFAGEKESAIRLLDGALGESPQSEARGR